jgi:hypothetical protein
MQVQVFVKGKANLTSAHVKKALEKILKKKNKKEMQVKEVCDFIELNRYFKISKLETLKKIDVLMSNNNYFYFYVNRYVKELEEFNIFTFEVKDCILYFKIKENVTLEELVNYLN